MIFVLVLQILAPNVLLEVVTSLNAKFFIRLCQVMKSQHRIQAAQAGKAK